MKKTRKIFPILLLLLCLLLSSCAFVSYTPFGDEEAKKALEDAKESYIERIETLSNPEYYLDENRIAYEIALQDALNELSECDTVDALANVFAKHAVIIEALPNDLTLVMEKVLDGIATYASPDDYREEERVALLALMEEFTAEVSASLSTSEMQKLFRDFQAEVYELKTDAVYYEEELAALKKELQVALPEIKITSRYRSGDQKTIAGIISQFNRESRELTVKEEVQALYNAALEKLDAVPTNDERYAEEKAALIEARLATLQAYAEEYSLAIDSLAEIKATLLTLPTKESISVYTAEYALSLADTAPLALHQELALTLAQNAALLDDYRKEEKSEIEALIAATKMKIRAATDQNTLASLLSSLKEELAKIPTDEALWQEEDAAFPLLLRETYGDAVLPAPEKLTEASSYAELAAIIDYYAFYQTSYDSFLRDTFRVKLTYEHKNAQWEINEVYWHAFLLRSAVGITGYLEEDGDHLVITLIPYALATESNTEEPAEVDRYTFLPTLNTDKSKYQKRDESFSDFGYLQYEKTLNGIWNTQQLWYALEREYIPITVPNSPAEKALERAKVVLREIIYDGMTTEEKLFAIYSWFSQNVKHDPDYFDYLFPEDREHFPDELAATLNAFHAEGALFDNYAVCCAYAKSALILLRLEGIEAYRVFVHGYTDNAIDNLGIGGYGSHAFIAFRASDGLFYFMDGYESYNTSATYLVKIFHLLMPEKLRNPYEYGYSNVYTDLPYGKDMPSLMTEKLTYAGHEIVVKNEAALTAMLDAFEEEEGTRLQISVLETPDTPFDVAAALKKDGRFSYKTFSFGGVTEYMIFK